MDIALPRRCIANSGVEQATCAVLGVPYVGGNKDDRDGSVIETLPWCVETGTVLQLPSLDERPISVGFSCDRLFYDSSKFTSIMNVAGASEPCWRAFLRERLSCAALYLKFR